MKRYFLLIVLVMMGVATLPEITAQQPKTTVGPKAGHKTTKKKAPSQSTQQPANGADAQAPMKDDLKRLILKDGSYQSVEKYQLIGDRVHYLSAERYEWEDIPKELIDWDASRKYAVQAAAENSRAKQIDSEAAQERAEEDANSPLVSPGIKLPPTGGIFLLDVYQNNPELNELAQNGADVNKNTKSNILRAAINPIASAKQTIELKGPHARVQSHVGNPFIYVALDPDADSGHSNDPQKQQGNWRIVKLKDKKGNRLVGDVNIAIYGKVKEKAEYIDTVVTPVSGPWIKVEPSAPLPPGEYALVEMLGQQGMNRFVWDFGVDPNAAANSGVWRAQPVRSDASEAEKKPELGKRE